MHRQHRVRNERNKKNRVLLLIVIGIIAVSGFFLIKGLKYVPIFFDLFFKKEITLKKTDNKVNVLLLGIGGGKHDGPNLTDTIIFASIDPESKNVTLVSIPRDLWVQDLKAKINTAYAFGEAKRDGGGLTLTKATVEKITGQRVDYAVRVDFAGFVKAVDMVGGLDLTVDRVLDDPEYPISGKEADTCGFEGEEFEKRATESSQLEAFPCRYETLHFDPGPHHMDGETALRFVRSRHAKGAEGTDFARSKRQEKVIQAFKEKIFSAQTLLNPIKLVSLSNIFKDSIDTDIKEEEYDDFVKLAQKVQEGKINSIVLDYGDAIQNRPGLLENPLPGPQFGGQWVIIPRIGNNNFTEVHAYVACVIRGGKCSVTPQGIVTSVPTKASTQ